MKKYMSLYLLIGVISMDSCAYAASEGYVAYTGTVIAEVNGISQRVQGAVIIDAAGSQKSVATLYDKSTLLDTVVSVEESDFGVTLEPVPKSQVSGRVNAAAKTIGSTKIADNVKILDTVTTVSVDVHPYVVVPLSRLDGLVLSADNVKYAKTDNSGKVCELYLSNATNDAYSYGVVVNSSSVFGNGCYLTPISSATRKLFTDEPVMFIPQYSYEIYNEFETDVDSGKLKPSHSELSGTAPLKECGYTTKIENGTAFTRNGEYKIGDNVQVFYKTYGGYVQTTLESVNNGEYILNCYYDTPQTSGGRVRIIIATSK